MRMLIITLLLICTGCLDTQNATSRFAIEGGEEETEQTGVVGIVIEHPDGDRICTGALITPDLVLTAQHCIAPLEGVFPICGNAPFGPRFHPEKLFVTNEHSMPFMHDEYISATDVFVPPNATEACGGDIALIKLATPILDAPLLSPVLDTAVEAGESYTAYGYGQRADGTGSSTRRRLENLTVQCVGDNACENPDVYGNEFEGSPGTCLGDSGGPAVAASGIVGVLSRGAGCGPSIYSHVFAWREWLVSEGQAATILGGYDLPVWVDADNDGDRIGDSFDNCPSTPNTEQTDLNRDGVGDACEPTAEDPDDPQEEKDPTSDQMFEEEQDDGETPEPRVDPAEGCATTTPTAPFPIVFLIALFFRRRRDG